MTVSPSIVAGMPGECLEVNIARKLAMVSEGEDPSAAARFRCCMRLRLSRDDSNLG
jgi:hypothetical protein